MVVRKKYMALKGTVLVTLLAGLITAPVSMAAETSLDLAPIEVTATGVIRDRAEAPMAVTVVEEEALQDGREEIGRAHV